MNTAMDETNLLPQSISPAKAENKMIYKEIGGKKRGEKMLY